MLVASFDDLKAATDRLVAGEHQTATEVQALTASVERLRVDFEQIRSQGVLTTEQQATLDAAVQSVTSAAADLATQTASMNTEQQAVDTADPAPTPTPAPQARSHRS